MIMDRGVKNKESLSYDKLKSGKFIVRDGEKITIPFRCLKFYDRIEALKNHLKQYEEQGFSIEDWRFQRFFVQKLLNLPSEAFSKK